MTWTLTWTSCAYIDQPNNLDNIVALQPKAHWMLGDHSYFAWGYTQFGVTTPPLVYNTSSAVWKTKADQFFFQPGWQKLLDYRGRSGMLLFWASCGDDHGLGGSNWDHTKESANDPGTTIGAITQDDVLTHWRNARAGHVDVETTYTDNPVLHEYNGEIPPAMRHTALATDYRRSYWYTDFATGGTVMTAHAVTLPSAAADAPGNLIVRVITLDTLSYKSPHRDPDTPNKLMLGEIQQQWLYDVCADAMTAGVQMIVIASTKELFNINNADGWKSYVRNRDAICEHLHGQDYPVVWIAGDRHYPHVGCADTQKTSAPDAYDMLSIGGAPFATPRADTLTPYPQKFWSAAETGLIDPRVYGVVEVDEDTREVHYALCDADAAPGTAALWRGTVGFLSRRLKTAAAKTKKRRRRV